MNYFLILFLLIFPTTFFLSLVVSFPHSELDLLDYVGWLKGSMWTLHGEIICIMYVIYKQSWWQTVVCKHVWFIWEKVQTDYNNKLNRQIYRPGRGFIKFVFCLTKLTYSRIVNKLIWFLPKMCSATYQFFCTSDCTFCKKLSMTLWMD